MSRATRIGLAAAAVLLMAGAGAGVALAVTSGSRTSATSMMSGYSGSMMSGGSRMMNGAGMTGAGMMGGSMMGGWSTSTGAVPSPIAGAQDVAVTADDLRFSPSTITLRADEAVNVTVHNADTIVHDLTIPMLGVHAVVQPGASVTFGLRVSTPGTYSFLCTVAGHAQAGMRGSLTVTG